MWFDMMRSNSFKIGVLIRSFYASSKMVELAVKEMGIKLMHSFRELNFDRIFEGVRG